MNCLNLKKQFIIILLASLFICNVICDDEENVEEANTKTANCGNFNPKKPLKNSVSGRVIGGERASPWPWAAHVRAHVEPDKRSEEEEDVDSEVNEQKCEIRDCGGVVIHESFILTAGHCLPVKDWTKFCYMELYVGRYDDPPVPAKQKKPEYIKIDSDQITVHPNFDGDVEYPDLALIHLHFRIPFGRKGKYKNVRPICWENTAKVTNSKCKIIGFGMTNQYPEQSPSYMQEATMPIIENQKCKPLLENEFNASGQICAGNLKTGRPDSCNGDSGSPLQCPAVGSNSKWHLLGILHGRRTENCSEPNSPKLFTRIETYTTWIKETIKQKLNPNRPSKIKRKSIPESPSVKQNNEQNLETTTELELDEEPPPPKPKSQNSGTGNSIIINNNNNNN